MYSVMTLHQPLLENLFICLLAIASLPAPWLLLEPTRFHFTVLATSMQEFRLALLVVSTVAVAIHFPVCLSPALVRSDALPLLVHVHI